MTTDTTPPAEGENLPDLIGEPCFKCGGYRVPNTGTPAPSRGVDREAVARAICDGRLWPGAYEQASEPERNAFLHDADSVLALLEPKP